jgi:tetratricopeptide (TPR) repeat protein
MKHPILSVYSTSSTAPIAQWSFDDRGNLASDRPDIAHARLIGSACCAVERVERGPHQSLHLAEGYVTLPVTPLLDVGEEDFSICAWIRTGDLGISTIIDKRIENSGPLLGWCFFIYAGRINLQLADSSGWFNYVYRGEQTASLPVVSDSQWHHVAVVIDRDQLDGGRWYVDGREVSWRFNPTSKQNSLSNSIPLTIGRRSDDFGGSFRGNIGDLRLCKWALSPEEVRSIYQSVQSPPSNGIAAPDAVPKNFALFDRGVRLPERYLYQEIEIESLDIHSHNSADSACRSLGKYSRAIEYYQQSLQIQRDMGNRYGEASSLNNLGDIYGSLGEYSRAIEYYQQSLQIQRDIGYRHGEATSLNALGNIYDLLGEYLRAIESHQQSLQIHRDIGNRHGEATCWRDLGRVYHSLGEYSRAIEYYQQSLDMARTLNSDHREVNSLNALGSVYHSLGEYQRVIKYCQQSLDMARDIDNHHAETASLNNLGGAYCSLGEYHRAIKYHHQALNMAQDIGDRSGEATSLSGLGNAYRCLGQYHRAIDYYQQSLGIAQSIAELALEGISLSNLGITLFNFGKLTDAERILRDGIEVWESIRRRLGSNDDFKVSIFEMQAETYSLLQKVLIAQDNPEAALEIAERGRARAFVELLASRLSANPDIILPNIDPPNIEQIQQIVSVQNATLVEYSIVSNEKLYIWVIQPIGQVTFRQVDLKSLNNSLFELVLDTRQSIGVRSRGQTPALAIAPGNWVKLNDDAPDWEPWQVVAVDAVNSILSLWQSSFPEGLTIPRPITDVATKVESLRTNHPHLQQLHQLLIEPIADFLPTDPEARVIFLPQGALFLVPFPALQDAQGKYLIEKHTILTAPAIQVLKLTRHKRQQVQGNALDILVMGNPTMPKVSLVLGDPPQQLAPLPHSEQEAFAIAQLFQTQALIGDQATKAAIVQQLPNARIIHLATHGLLDNIRGMGSAIALAPCGTDNGLLTAEEILELNLNAELVILSACNTGMGRLTGDGVIGLSRSLISAGTPSVIVSLWAVPDAPTADLMTEFYQNFQRTGDKAQALRQAMLTTMQAHPNPRDWAAFTLIGEAE